MDDSPRGSLLSRRAAAGVHGAGLSQAGRARQGCARRRGRACRARIGEASIRTAWHDSRPTSSFSARDESTRGPVPRRRAGNREHGHGGRRQRPRPGGGAVGERARHGEGGKGGHGLGQRLQHEPLRHRRVLPAAGPGAGHDRLVHDQLLARGRPSLGRGAHARHEPDRDRLPRWRGAAHRRRHGDLGGGLRQDRDRAADGEADPGGAGRSTARAAPPPIPRP